MLVLLCLRHLLRHLLRLRLEFLEWVRMKGGSVGVVVRV